MHRWVWASCIAVRDAFPLNLRRLSLSLADIATCKFKALLYIYNYKLNTFISFLETNRHYNIYAYAYTCSCFKYLIFLCINYFLFFLYKLNAL